MASRSRPSRSSSSHTALLAFWSALFLAHHRVGGTATSPTGAGDLLRQHLTDSTEFDWSRPDNGRCPSWVTNYTAFHRAMRGTPEAKYLVHTCHSRRDCFHGLGDRMRGLYPAIQLAIAHKRVLLIDWASPSPLEHFLVPAQIDWTVTPDLGVDVRQGSAMSCCNRFKFRNNVGDKDNRVWTLSTNSMPFHSHLDRKLPKEVPQFRRVSWHAHCFMTALFQPSPSLRRAVDAEQLKLLGGLDRPFVAVHLRMGHLEGEQQNLARGWDHTEGLLAAYQCAWRRNHLLHAANATAPTPPQPAPATPPNATAASAPRTAPLSRRLPTVDAARVLLGTAAGGSGGGRRSVAIRRVQPPHRHQRARRGRRALRASDVEEGIPQRLRAHLHGLHLHQHHHHHNGSRLHPMLLLTDHGKLRASVAHGMLAGMVGPDYSAYHIAQYQARSGAPPEEQERASLTTFVDLMLLARARCLVWAPSGFPMVAMTLGFNPCTIDIYACIREGRGIKVDGLSALPRLSSAG